jgi:hypothetical protein
VANNENLYQQDNNMMFRHIAVFLMRTVGESLLSVILFSGSTKTKIWTGIILALVALGTGAYYLSPTLFPTATRPIPQTLDDAISEVCRDVPAQLPRPVRALQPTLLLPLTDDREGLFTNHLRSALDQQGWYRPVEKSLLDKAFETVRELTGIGADPSVRSMQWTPTELAGMMRSAKAETVLRGSVDRLSMTGDGTAEIILRLERWELSAPDPAPAELTRSLVLERPGPPVPPLTSFWNRLRPYAIFILIGLVYPFAMIPWMRWAIREDSNAAILKTLLGITAIPVLAFLIYLVWHGKSALDLVLQGGTAALFLFFYTAFLLNAMQNKLK